MTIKRYLNSGTFHRVTEYNSVLYLSGIIASDLSMTAVDQCSNVMREADKLLRRFGSDKNKMLTVTVYLTDIEYKNAMNRAWLDWLNVDQLPSRTTICVQALAKDVQVELSITAMKQI